jgi:hypothetical protein
MATCVVQHRLFRRANPMLGDRRARRKWRTATLGLLAFATLMWGAVDIVGVPITNMLSALGYVSVGVLGIGLLAAVPAWFLARRRAQRGRLF